MTDPSTKAPSIDQVATELKNDAATLAQAVESNSPNNGAAIETWFGDLIQSVPALRETDTYNKLRTAVNDLKTKVS